MKPNFQKHFCQVCWTEKSSTAQVALDILDSVIILLETTYKIPKRSSNENKIISNNEIILSLGKSLLIKPKLHVFISLLRLPEQFLVKYQ